MTKPLRDFGPSGPDRRVRVVRIVCGTFGTDLAAAGIDLLVLRDLMGHAHVETTAAYVHLAPETIAAEWARAREAQR